MTVDPRTPVLVGAAAVSESVEAPALMVAAAEAAARDAGNTDLLRAAQWVLVPRGSWTYHDAARLVAGAVGNHTAKSIVADIGVLQTTLLSRAASAIADGELDIALIAGGEARHRLVQGRIAGAPVPDTDDTGAEPDERLTPHGMIVSRAEIDAGLITAPSQYSLIENARRYADGQSLAEHHDLLRAMRDSYAAVAAANPDAWHRGPIKDGDRPIAFPYTKADVSQWNVDQAAALIVCSAGAARAHGVPSERWLFPHAIVESNAMIPVTQRTEVHRSPGFALAGARALELAGVAIDDIAHLDLYSCFPIAVRVQAAEMGIGRDRQLTVTGGMNYGGGPLNNYALQALARMATVLRAEPGTTGLATAISGMITKQGVGIWSTTPPARPCRAADVTAAVEAATDRCPDAPGATGTATVVSSTVLFDREGSADRGVVVVDAAGGRAIAITTDPDTMTAMTATEWCGRAIELDGQGGFRA